MEHGGPRLTLEDGAKDDGGGEQAQLGDEHANSVIPGPLVVSVEFPVRGVNLLEGERQGDGETQQGGAHKPTGGKHQGRCRNALAKCGDSVSEDGLDMHATLTGRVAGKSNVEAHPLVRFGKYLDEILIRGRVEKVCFG